MKEKIEKVKGWFKENWMYVAGGAATASVIALAIVKGIKPDDCVIDPIVIDRGKEDWMDQLFTYEKYSCNDRFMTAREACAALDWNELARSYLIDKGILTKEVEKDIYNVIKADDRKMFDYLYPILDGYGFFVSDEEK